VCVPGAWSHHVAQPAPATAAAGAAPAEGRSLPEVELTGPLLFEIVAAEVAVQRGESAPLSRP